MLTDGTPRICIADTPIFVKNNIMGINTIGRIFMPKNRIFYNLFEEVADRVYEMGIKLKEPVLLHK
jgi:hypothetical protein